MSTFFSGEIERDEGYKDYDFLSVRFFHDFVYEKIEQGEAFYPLIEYHLHPAVKTTADDQLRRRTAVSRCEHDFAKFILERYYEIEECLSFDDLYIKTVLIKICFMTIGS